MRPETTHTLYEVQDLMKEAREKLDARMYRSAIILPDEDLDYCRKVYSAVCKVLDLL
jgi:DNA-dependent RNA polymerase auxiliary subunit epsilon